MSDLKPCPFCTAALVWSDTYSEYHHPVAKCILSGHKFKKGMIGQWNRRALPAVQPDAAALVGHMTKLIAAGLDRIEQLTAERDRLGRELNVAKYGQPDFAWSVHLAAMAEVQAERDRLLDALQKLSCKCSSNCDWEHGDICPSWVASAALKGESDDQCA